jgi:hypothetical protein
MSETQCQAFGLAFTQFVCIQQIKEYFCWPAPGSEDTELGVFMGPEVRHGEAEVHARVQA